MDWKTQEEFKDLAKKVMAVASEKQKKIFKDMQSGDEKLFLHLLKEPITQSSIDKRLEIMVNSVEGDTSQLSKELQKYADTKGWIE